MNSIIYCNICEDFIDKQKWNEHERIHTPDDKHFYCNFCGTSFFLMSKRFFFFILILIDINSIHLLIVIFVVELIFIIK